MYTPTPRHPVFLGGSTRLRRYSVLYEGSPEPEPDAVICPGGPTLFQMLEPCYMVGSYHQPPEDLPILHELLQMSSHLISDGIHLSHHNGEVSIDKGHDGQILVGG